MKVIKFKICFVLMVLYFTPLTQVVAQTSELNQQKYWYYRDRFYKHFVAYSDDYSIPDRFSSEATHSLTETLCLSHPGKSSLNSYSLKASCYKPFLAVKDSSLTCTSGKNKQHNFIKGLGAAALGGVSGVLFFSSTLYLVRYIHTKKLEARGDHTVFTPDGFAAIGAFLGFPIGVIIGLKIHINCKKKKEMNNALNNNISLVYSVN